MPTLKFDCPRCGAKQAAIQSSTYPDSIVHKCEGKTLHEVALYRNGQILSTTGSPLSVGSVNLNLFTTQRFSIEKVTSPDDLSRYGTMLNNAASVRTNAERYIQTGSVYIVKNRQSHAPLYMILIEKRTIPGSQYFSGSGVKPVPKADGEEVLRALIGPVLDKNPFPDQFRI